VLRPRRCPVGDFVVEGDLQSEKSDVARPTISSDRCEFRSNHVGEECFRFWGECAVRTSSSAPGTPGVIDFDLLPPSVKRLNGDPCLVGDAEEGSPGERFLGEVVKSRFDSLELVGIVVAVRGDDPSDGGG
jgi:hypothetical protein